MEEQFVRTELIIGTAAAEKLKNSHVAVFGIGGVGGYVCEALSRAGVGSFDLIDRDTVSESNINRQIIALHSTIGKYKTEVMRARMLDINPSVQVTVHNVFFLPENADSFDFSAFDYVVDCVDTVSAKIALAEICTDKKIPIISSMGAGNKLDPCAFKVSDIYDTKVCPLAHVMRRELKKRNIKALKCVYSEEKPIVRVPNAFEYKDKITDGTCAHTRPVPGSISFVPSVVGLIIAGEIVRDLISSV